MAEAPYRRRLANRKVAKKNCRVCQERISALATKCPHCSSYQDWRVRISPVNMALALLVALVSVVSMAVPMVKSALTPDNSQLAITYLDRADVTVPIVVSNKGSRPAVISSKAGLKMFFGDSGASHGLLLSAMDQSRGDLLIPENSSKQYFYMMDSQQPLSNIYPDLVADIKRGAKLTKCVFVITHLDFQGKNHKNELILYDASDPKWQGNGNEIDHGKFLSELECRGKIPQPVRKHYGIGG